ncbi:MAG: DUF1592 domain-containing protein [Myxococcota bacterium]
MRRMAWLAIASMALGGCRDGGGESPEASDSTSMADDGADDGSADDGSDDADDDGGPAVVCEDDDLVPATPLRRLSQKEMANTLRALLGTTEALEERIPADSKVGGFSNNAHGTPMSPLLVDAHFRLIEELAAEFAADPANLACGPATEEACLDVVLDTFGRRAYRHTMSDAERGVLTNLFAQARADNDFETTMGLVVQAMLLSPQFLYRIENGGELRALESGELASRLSFFLWAEGPDDALLDIAEDDGLLDPGQRDELIDSMLDDPRAKQGAEVFFMEWLDVDDLHDIERSESLFPDFDDALLASMREETRRFVGHVALDEELGLDTLLTADFTIADARLAAHYGANAPDEEWGVVSLDPEQRAGVLSHASVMTQLGHTNQTSPIHRGLFVRQRLLCASLPPPPPDLVISLPEVDPTMSTRERFARHAQQDDCKVCHELIDPVGLAFEHYDATGAWRETEGDNVAVSGAGRLDGFSDLSPLFYGAPGLAAMLADYDGFDTCMTRQMFRFAHGREELPDDSCTIQSTTARYQDEGRTYRALVKAHIESALFLNRESGAPQ